MKDKSLPKNRLDVFLDVFQMSWHTLVYISLFLGLFILPIILVVIFSQLANISIFTNINPDDLDAVLKATKAYYYHNLYTILYLFPTFIIASFGLAGSFNVIRKLVWLERVDFFDAFIKGIKGNVSKIIFNAVILTFVYAMSILVYLYFSYNSLTPIVQSLIIGFTVIFAILLLNFVFHGYSQMVIYNNNLFSYIKNNFIFAILSFFKSLVVLMLSLILIPIGFLFESVVGIVIVYSFYLLIGFGYAILLFTLNSHCIFDKLINKEHYPTIYRKGLNN